MIEFYPQIKAVHIGCVLASVVLFTVRGLGLLAGQRWPHSALPRYASWAIDTTLLTAALMLVAILPGALFANHWLTVKLVLLVVYVGLGHFALSRREHRRWPWLLAALACYGFMYSVARSHHPLGVFAQWFG